MDDLISRQRLLKELKHHKELFCRNRIEFLGLSKNDKARVDEIDNCYAMVINAPSAQPETHEERTKTHACDCISRQAAIDAVEILLEQTEEDADVKTWNNAIRGAINSIKHHVPSAQQVRTQMSSADDLISRQAAIDAMGIEPLAFSEYENGLHDKWEDDVEALMKLSPAQPEIVRCKDCKHKGTKNCVANAWTTIFGFMVKDDFYCGLAERRTDDV